MSEISIFSDPALVQKMVAVLTDNSLDQGERLQLSVDLLLERIGARSGSVMLVDDKSKLRVVAATNKKIIGMSQEISPGSVSGYVSIYLEPLLVKDINTDSRFGGRQGNYKTSSLISIPLISGKKDHHLIGVVNASDKDNEASFNDNDLALTVGYSKLISPLIDNLCFLERIKKEKTLYQRTARELELKQKELVIASTERAELVQMVVHDFKSPLSAVISNLDLLKYMGLNSEQEPVVETAFKGASNLLDMMNDFLNIARIDHWKEEAGQLKPVPLQPVLDRVLESVGLLAMGKGQHLEIQDAADLMVMGDFVLLEHLIQNLLSNAVKYTQDGGSIKLSWKTWKSKRLEDPFSNVVQISVEDNGPGINDQLKQDVFKKFNRAGRDRDSQVQGTGFGLFICQKIVLMLKGRIWIEDADPVGSRFCVIIYGAEETDDRSQSSCTCG